MDEIEKHISYLFAAELQFRLASAIRLAVTMENQPLDLPTNWVHGDHGVTYEEIALRQDQADFAAWNIHKSVTLMMAVAIKDAIEAITPNLSKAVKKAKTGIIEVIENVIKGVKNKPWLCSDEDVSVAYHIARLIRNAYAHAPFAPVWKIHNELQDKVFDIPGVIQLNSKGLNGKPFDWRHYGGPLAMLHFCRYVRFEILKDEKKPRKIIPKPNDIYIQQGNLILKRLDEE